MNGRICLGASLCVGWLSLWAAGARAEVVSLRVPEEPPTVTAGDTVLAELSVVVAPGFHVQANPAADEFLVPFSLEWNPSGRWGVDRVEYPPGVRFRLEGAERDLLVYSGVFRLPVELRVPEGQSEGRRSLTGVLRYQACNRRFCLPPAHIPFDLEVEVSDLRQR